MMGADITAAIRMSFIGAILCTHYSRPLILYTVPLYFFQSPCLDQSVRQYRHMTVSAISSVRRTGIDGLTHPLCFEICHRLLCEIVRVENQFDGPNPFRFVIAASGFAVGYAVRANMSRLRMSVCI
jgi:hypothetical protein